MNMSLVKILVQHYEETDKAPGSSPRKGYAVFHTMDLWQFLKMDWIVTATGEWSSWHLDGRM